MSDLSGREKPKMVNDVVTDRAGGFAEGGPPGQAGGMSYGEEHELEAELQRECAMGTFGSTRGTHRIPARPERPFLQYN